MQRVEPSPVGRTAEAAIPALVDVGEARVASVIFLPDEDNSLFSWLGPLQNIAPLFDLWAGLLVCPGRRAFQVEDMLQRVLGVRPSVQVAHLAVDDNALFPAHLLDLDPHDVGRFGGREAQGLQWIDDVRNRA